MIAAVLRERGVPHGAIEIIPDEQEAIGAALRMGQRGDLLLLFADALTRSWKQIIKFKCAEPDSQSTGATAGASAAASAAVPGRAANGAAGPTTGGGAWGASAGAGAPAPAAADESSLEAQGFVRDERGLRFVGEAAD